MERREFFSSGLLMGIGTLPASYGIAGEVKSSTNELLDVILTMPNFCSHEHWGSVASIGNNKNGYLADFKPGALPSKKTNLVDLIIDPYMTGNLHNNGISPDKIVLDNGTKADIFPLAQKNSAGCVPLLRKILAPQQFTGIYMCLREGVRFAYDMDIHEMDADLFRQTSQTVAANYADLFGWYKRLMEKAHFTRLIRPVHPEFYFSTNTMQAAAEMAFTDTVLRIDPLLDMYKDSERRQNLTRLTGVEPVDAASWRLFLEKIFQAASDREAVGIKQLQAYRRDLDFAVHEDSDIKFDGASTKEEKIFFKDWVVNECCKLADDLNWPHQVHVGTDNMPHSNPLPLAALARRYRNQKIVMLHCWPFLQESAYLAKKHPNIYIDICWQPILNPEFLVQSLGLWLNYVPLNKITMGNDATSIEMAVGSSILAKHILASVLDRFGANSNIEKNQLLQTALDFLHNNAVHIYKVGNVKFI